MCKFATHGVIAILATVISVMSAAPASAQTDAVSFLPRAEVGVLSYSLDFDGVVPSPIGGTLEVDNQFNFTFTSLKLGASVVWRSFYLDGYYTVTTDDSDTQLFPEFNNLPLKWTGDREEYSFALGYAVTNGISAFAGYRDSSINGEGTTRSDFELTHDGYYVGASYRWKLTKTGSVNFSGAYAWLDAEITEQVFGIPLAGASGDGDGVKVSVQWVDFLNSNAGYSVGADFFQYQHELSNSAEGVDVDAEEREAVIRVGLFLRI